MFIHEGGRERVKEASQTITKGLYRLVRVSEGFKACLAFFFFFKESNSGRHGQVWTGL